VVNEGKGVMMNDKPKKPATGAVRRGEPGYPTALANLLNGRPASPKKKRK
jgi:hypothetical protein